ncbi:hypothetical protein J7K24_02820 [bacterium]|nr:hypothetical protein [bacterium]
METEKQNENNNQNQKNLFSNHFLKEIVLFVVIVIVVAVIGIIAYLIVPRPTPVSPPVVSYSLDDPELSWEGWGDLKNKVGKKINLDKIFIEKEEGCAFGGFCLSCEEGKVPAKIYNKVGMIDACVDSKTGECFFGAISGKIAKTTWHPLLPEASEQTVYYLDDVMISKCFEEKPAVSIDMDAPEMVTVDQPFEVKIEVINNWTIPLNNIEFGLRKESGFSLLPAQKESECNREAGDDNFWCKTTISLDAGESKSFSFTLLPTVWVPPGGMLEIYPLPDFVPQIHIPIDYTIKYVRIMSH